MDFGPMPGLPGGFNLMFTIFPLIFGLMFLLVFGLIIFTIARGVGEWSKNNSQPVLTVAARVISKRTNISRGMHHHNDMHHHTSSTDYFITFEVESGDRMELRVAGSEYGLVVEGDLGKLTFQGTRYHSFKRILETHE